MSEITTADIDSLLTDIGAFGFADLPSDQRRQRTAELLDLAEVALISLRAANARLQAWHDAVRSDPWWYDEHGNEIMFRPQPLAKE